MFAVSSNQWFRWLIEVAKKRKQSVVLMMGSENCLEYKKKTQVTCKNYQCILCSTCESYDVMEKKMNARFWLFVNPICTREKKIKKKLC